MLTTVAAVLTSLGCFFYGLSRFVKEYKYKAPQKATYEVIIRKF